MADGARNDIRRRGLTTCRWFSGVAIFMHARAGTSADSRCPSVTQSWALLAAATWLSFCIASAKDGQRSTTPVEPDRAPGFMFVSDKASARRAGRSLRNNNKDN
jgi:hypothetical protein